MRANLMFCDKDFDTSATACYDEDALSADLELQRILSEMSQGDETVARACAAALFNPLSSPEEIRYRQENLRDVFRSPEAVQKLYAITVETEKQRKSSWHWLSSTYLASTFSSAVDLMTIYTSMLKELRLVADSALSSFQSDGFCSLLTMLRRELDDDYIAEVLAQLNDLKRGDGSLVSATLGTYLQGIHYVLRRKNRKGPQWQWLFAPSFTIAARDDAGATDLGKRRDRAINEAANALAQAAEHLEGFFAMLRGELAFYIGCLNLADSLRKLDMPICIPAILPSASRDRAWQGLYDASLALTKKAAVVGNDLRATDKQLYVITGANQGGKSTFLRSMGQAQLMSQCGMFVSAAGFSAPIRNGVFTHFKKEEDTAMKSGKLDEELVRMSAIADHVKRGSMVLFNESFAATNEREGSEICRQITQALTDNDIEVFSVTHLYTYAASFRNTPGTQYLRAQRMEDGARTFRIMPGEPLETAFGEDLYAQIIG